MKKSDFTKWKEKLKLDFTKSVVYYTRKKLTYELLFMNSFEVEAWVNFIAAKMNLEN